MRERKFRGQSKDGRWHFGSLITLEDNDGELCYFIFEGGKSELQNIEPWDDFILVKPETVGQFSELTDNNENEIYEGDIVLSEYGDKVEVFWDGTGWGLRDTAKKDYFGCPEMYDFKKFRFEKATVIGNIHDNLK